MIHLKAWNEICFCAGEMIFFTFFHILKEKKQISALPKNQMQINTYTWFLFWINFN